MNKRGTVYKDKSENNRNSFEFKISNSIASLYTILLLISNQTSR